MEQAFVHAGNLAQSNMFTKDVMNGIACIVLSSIEMIQGLLERTLDLQRRLGHGKNRIDGGWSKVGWQLFRKEELRQIKSQLHERLTSVNTLIVTAS